MQGEPCGLTARRTHWKRQERKGTVGVERFDSIDDLGNLTVALAKLRSEHARKSGHGIDERLVPSRRMKLDPPLALEDKDVEKDNMPHGMSKDGLRGINREQDAGCGGVTSDSSGDRPQAMPCLLPPFQRPRHRRKTGPPE